MIEQVLTNNALKLAEVASKCLLKAKVRLNNIYLTTYFGRMKMKCYWLNETPTCTCFCLCENQNFMQNKIFCCALLEIYVNHEVQTLKRKNPSLQLTIFPNFCDYK